MTNEQADKYCSELTPEKCIFVKLYSELTPEQKKNSCIKLYSVLLKALNILDSNNTLSAKPNADSENERIKYQKSMLTEYFPGFEKDYQKLRDYEVIQETENGLRWNFSMHNATTFVVYFREQVKDKDKRLKEKDNNGEKKPLRLTTDERKLLIRIFKVSQNVKQLGQLDRKGKTNTPNYLNLKEKLET